MLLQYYQAKWILSAYEPKAEKICAVAALTLLVVGASSQEALVVDAFAPHVTVLAVVAFGVPIDLRAFDAFRKEANSCHTLVSIQTECAKGFVCGALAVGHAMLTVGTTSVRVHFGTVDAGPANAAIS